MDRLDFLRRGTGISSLLHDYSLVSEGNNIHEIRREELCGNLIRNESRSSVEGYEVPYLCQNPDP